MQFHSYSKLDGFERRQHNKYVEDSIDDEVVDFEDLLTRALNEEELKIKVIKV